MEVKKKHFLFLLNLFEYVFFSTLEFFPCKCEISKTLFSRIFLSIKVFIFLFSTTSKIFNINLKDRSCNNYKVKKNLVLWNRVLLWSCVFSVCCAFLCLKITLRCFFMAFFLDLHLNVRLYLCLFFYTGCN